MRRQLAPRAGSSSPSERRVLVFLIKSPSALGLVVSVLHVPSSAGDACGMFPSCRLGAQRAPYGYPYAHVEINRYINISRLSAQAPFVALTTLCEEAEGPE